MNNRADPNTLPDWFPKGELRTNHNRIIVVTADRMAELTSAWQQTEYVRGRTQSAGAKALQTLGVPTIQREQLIPKVSSEQAQSHIDTAAAREAARIHAQNSDETITKMDLEQYGIPTDKPALVENKPVTAPNDFREFTPSDFQPQAVEIPGMLNGASGGTRGPSAENDPARANEIREQLRRMQNTNPDLFEGSTSSTATEQLDSPSLSDLNLPFEGMNEGSGGPNRV